MHELSIAQNIYKEILVIAKREKVGSVVAVKIGIGAFSGAVNESLAFCFSEIQKGTELEKTKITLKEIPIKIRCSACSKEFITTNFNFTCKYCNSTNTTIIEGQDIIILEIEAGD